MIAFSSALRTFRDHFGHLGGLDFNELAFVFGMDAFELVAQLELSAFDLGSKRRKLTAEMRSFTVQPVLFFFGFGVLVGKVLAAALGLFQIQRVDFFLNLLHVFSELTVANVVEDVALRSLRLVDFLLQLGDLVCQLFDVSVNPLDLFDELLDGFLAFLQPLSPRC